MVPTLLDHVQSSSAGVPNYRTKVQYIPQRPSLLPGTPIDFLNRIQSFASRQSPSSYQKDGDRKEGRLDPYRIAEEWGIDRVMWGREWSTLSGGEGQRIALAIAIGVGRAEVVLLDGESTFSHVGTRRELGFTGWLNNVAR
jgi:ABC-type iron transport system FetAB ATPase subunit